MVVIVDYVLLFVVLVSSRTRMYGGSTTVNEVLVVPSNEGNGRQLHCPVINNDAVKQIGFIQCFRFLPP